MLSSPDLLHDYKEDLDTLHVLKSSLADFETMDKALEARQHAIHSNLDRIKLKMLTPVSHKSHKKKEKDDDDEKEKDSHKKKEKDGDDDEKEKDSHKSQEKKKDDDEKEKDSHRSQDVEPKVKNDQVGSSTLQSVTLPPDQIISKAMDGHASSLAAQADA